MSKLFNHAKSLQRLFHGQLPATLVSFIAGFVFAVGDTLCVWDYFPFFPIFFFPGVVGKHTSKYEFRVIIVIYEQICVYHCQISWSWSSW